MRLSKTTLMASAGMALLLPATPVFGQETAPPPQDTASSTSDDTIIVTANRRRETLLEVPQAISVLSGETLRDLGADSFSDYARFVPGVEFAELAPGATRITVRGISNELTVGVSTISYYVDEIAITSPSQVGQPDFKMVDIARVEILRGPQGTLYGEGSLGGTIRIVTNQPELDRWGGDAELTVGTIDNGGTDLMGNAVLNIPIVRDVLAVRLVGIYRDEGGWIDNVAPGFEQEDTNEARTRGGRVSLLFTPTDRLTIRGMAVFNRLDVDNANIINSGVDFIGNGLTSRTDDYDLYNGTIEYAFGGFTLTSATSYLDRDAVSQAVDPAATIGTINFIGGLLGAAPVTRSTAFTAAGNRNFTQEIRLVSTGNGPLQWIVGGFYRDGRSSSNAFRVLDSELTFGPGNPYGQPAGTPVPGGILTNFSSVDRTDYALFGQGTWAVTDRLDLTYGIRWFDYNQSVVSGASGGFVGFTNGVFEPAPFVGDRDEDGFTHRAAISYSINNRTEVYGSVSTGFRSGGINALNPIPGIPEGYTSDDTINYELGGKFILAEGRVRFNTALFYIDWNDMQAELFNPLVQIAYVANVGAAHSMGIEAELTLTPMRGLSILMSGTLQEAETDSSFGGSSGGTVAAGARLPFVPQWKFGVAADYNWGLTRSLNGVLHGDISGVGASFSRLEPGVNEQFGFGDNRLGSYVIANLRAGIENEHFGAYLFIENVTNEVAELADDNFGGRYRNKPRTIGLNLRAHF